MTSNYRHSAYSGINPANASAPAVNLFYLEESIKTYESLIAAFEQRGDVLRARHKTARGPMLFHLEESMRLNEATIKAMERALKSAQENFWVVSGLTLAKKNQSNHEISA